MTDEITAADWVAKCEEVARLTAALAESERSLVGARAMADDFKRRADEHAALQAAAERREAAVVEANRRLSARVEEAERRSGEAESEAGGLRFKVIATERDSAAARQALAESQAAHLRCADGHHEIEETLRAKLEAQEQRSVAEELAHEDTQDALRACEHERDAALAAKEEAERGREQAVALKDAAEAGLRTEREKCRTFVAEAERERDEVKAVALQMAEVAAREYRLQRDEARSTVSALKAEVAQLHRNIDVLLKQCEDAEHDASALRKRVGALEDVLRRLVKEQAEYLTDEATDEVLANARALLAAAPRHEETR